MPDNKTTATKSGSSVTLVGTMVNGLLIVFKFIAGIYGNSQALIADAVHSVSDLFTDAIVLLGLLLGRKAPDEKHHFGHARIETLASSIIGIALIATAVYIGLDAAYNIYNHTGSHPTSLALIGAGVSVLVKEILYHYTLRTGRRIKSQLVVANAWHHRSDALSSVAVLLGVAGTQVNPAWSVLDSFAALLVSIFIVKVGLTFLKDSLLEFIDTAPKSEVVNRITQCALSVEGVINAHDLRARTSGGTYQMEIHIVVDGSLTVFEGHRIAKEVEACLLEEIEDLGRVVVHIDPKI